MNLRGPKVKIARQLALAITPKAARIMERRPHPPGQHGPNQRRSPKVSEYKKQLVEKQRLRAQYNISERQLRNLFERARREQGNTGDRLVQLLEMRLDMVVHRSGWGRTIFSASQLVAHRHILVNGVRCDVRSRVVEVGDVIEVREASRDLLSIATALESQPVVPAYLDVDNEAKRTRVRELPARTQIPIICETSLVVEFYSR